MEFDQRFPEGRALCFGPFRLFPAQRLLREGDTPVRLGSRALEILIALVERRGELVSKGELIARVWPNVAVEEANLKVHIATLRKVLGDGRPGRRYLVTVSGFGYQFVAPVELSGPLEKRPAGSTVAFEPPHNLPASLIRPVGRADAIETLAKQLPQHRVITIVGPGGIGKSTIALAVAEALVDTYQHGARFVDLASLSDSKLVPHALASVLGVTIQGESAIPELVERLRDKRALIVFDSCEHVTEAVATLIEQLLNEAPGVNVLTTSREPLRARNEHLHHLSPLAVPPFSGAITAAKALEYPSVQLFIERASANLDEFELTDAEAPAVAEICAKLEGIPLAIELAATRVELFGVRQLSLLLDDRIRLLKFKRHTTVRRHQTLNAALDWSYELLSEHDRALLLQLSIFRGAFTLDSAIAVARDTNCDVIEGLASLVSKSLISVDVGEAIAKYRLLDTTRAYAMQKLVESGQFQDCSRRHAEYNRDLLERAENGRPLSEWMRDYAFRIDDVRSALNWAFSPDGDVSIGIALAATSVLLFRRLSLGRECSEYVERALAKNEARADCNEHDKLKLLVAYTATLTGLGGPLPNTEVSLLEALRLARKLKSDKYLLRAMFGLFAYRMYSGNRREALSIGEEFCALCEKTGDTDALVIANQLMGVALHYIGDQTRSRRHFDYMLANQVDPNHWSTTVSVIVDHRVAAQVTLSRVYWVQGFPNQAMRAALNVLNETKTTQGSLPLCNVLGLAACPVSLHIGDLTMAERLTSTLLEHSTNMASWHGLGRCFDCMLSVVQGDSSKLESFRNAINRMRDTRFNFYEGIFLGELAQGLAGVGQIVDALTNINEAIERCNLRGELWCMPELARIKGEVLRLQGTTRAVEAAERQFAQALELARKQEALSWELRAAMSLAELWQQQRKSEDAVQLLASVYSRFTEGFETSDLRKARGLIDKFGEALPPLQEPRPSGT